MGVQFSPGTGLVVQLVERRIRIAEFRGSTPLESTVLEKKDRRGCRFFLDFLEA